MDKKELNIREKRAQYLTAYSPDNADDAEIIVTRCPVCNRIRFTYGQLKYHCIKSHQLVGVNIQYKDQLLTYSWGSRLDAIGEAKNLL